MQETAPSPQSLMAIDSAFSRMSEEKGMKAAFLYYADKKVIKLNQNRMPDIGWEALEKNLPSENNFSLVWKPTHADIAHSGELGYTFGEWKLISKPSEDSTAVSYGVYVSIWKKNEQGEWKFVLDGGNATPGPFTAFN